MLIAKKDPVKLEPPSPLPPAVRKASMFAGLPAESIRPASTRLCALTTGPVLGPLWPSSAGLTASAL